VFVHLKAILAPVCLSKLVTFLIFGDMKVKEAHFSFFLGFVRLVGEGGLNYFLCHAMPQVVDQGSCCFGYVQDGLPFIC